MFWTYRQPTEVRFSLESRHALPSLAKDLGRFPVFVTDRNMIRHENAQEALAALGAEAKVFSDIDPNPTFHSVDALAAQIREQRHDFLIAMGGGSAPDCATRRRGTVYYTGTS